jgi:aspartate/methionine/tyrosine aminotransferase
MNIEPFALERWQSEWENQVRHNLSESGVHALSADELLAPGEAEGLLSHPLHYGYSNGSEELREAIASLYPGARPENVVVTNGSAEANFVSLWKVIEPDDEVVALLPNYMQLPELVKGFGAKLVPVRLLEESGWALDVEALERAVGPQTRLIVVANPNNPTGAVLSEEEMDAVASIAAKRGAYLLSDEVYRGAEREGPETPTFWGRYDRLFVTCGLSKAYGLPGLRIGWVVSDVESSPGIWARKDYTSIFPGLLSDFLARRALANRDRILERTRSILRANYPVLREWLEQRSELFRFTPPRAGAIAFARYRLPLGSTELVSRLREEKACSSSRETTSGSTASCASASETSRRI